MDTPAMEELAARVEGMGRALLVCMASLEVDGLVDGPQLTTDLRQAIPTPTTRHMAGAVGTLCDLARALDEAREWRMRCVCPPDRGNPLATGVRPV